MKVAAFQAPLPAAGSMEALEWIRECVLRCEQQEVTILCCPEAILGGLADDHHDPASFAIESTRLAEVLAPLTSDRVTTIVGFTEAADGGWYNAAAVFHRGAVAGIYRKIHPAIRRSVYRAGRELPVFDADGLRFGIVICCDSTHPELARRIAGQGAAVLFVPTNNGMPESRGGARLAAEARKIDIAAAMEHRLWVVRADVAGRIGQVMSSGATGIVRPDGSPAGDWQDCMLVGTVG